MATVIQIKRTVTLTTEVPFDEKHYPSMNISEAVAYEMELDVEQKLELFAEEIGEAALDDIEVSETIEAIEV
jgi:tRNA C32,U32 (ribose-2'-O)-methylase TrmJ